MFEASAVIFAGVAGTGVLALLFVGVIALVEEALGQRSYWFTLPLSIGLIGLWIYSFLRLAFTFYAGC